MKDSEKGIASLSAECPTPPLALEPKETPG